MNLEQMRARLAVILSKLEGFKSDAQLTDEDAQEINALSSEFENLKTQIEAKEKIEAITKSSTESVRKVAPPKAEIEVGQDRRMLDPKAGFGHAGEFYKAVMQASSGRVDKRLNAGMKESIGEDGGFLIPADFRTAIVEKVMGDESLLPLTQKFTTSSNNLTLPVSEVAPWDSTGIQAYWDGEGAAATESKHKFGEESFRLHKLTAYVKCTEELLSDAPALESYIKAKAPEAMAHKINTAILSGSGVGMPKGLLNSTFKYTVAKQGGQAADTVMFENVNNMLGRILPMSFPKAVWLVNPAVLPQLRLMKFDSSATSPVPVYLPPTGLAEAPFGTLFGRPIKPMMSGVKALGDEGDLILADLSYFYSVLKTEGVKSDVSTHVHFATSETAFKFSMRMAGHVPFKSNVTTENGAFEMSAFVTLADRA